MRTFYCLSLLALSVTTAFSQSFENIQALTQGNKVILSYDLLASRPDDQFSVAIYSSHDNYTNPLKMVTGDVGANVKTGLNKRVEWNAEELKTFKGEITFELRGNPVLLKLNFRFPMTNVKKGKATSIEWLGGSPTAPAKLYLFQGEKMISSVAETTNSGKYQWTIPKDVSSGEGYYYKLTAGNESVNSTTFSIKKKMPLLLKLSPLIIGAAVVGVLSSGGGDDPTKPVTDPSLPTPPEPGG
jgi:hypothetical protein